MRLLVFENYAGDITFETVAAFVPRIGEWVLYNLGPTREDEWDEKALADIKKLRGRKFRVMQILHEFRKSVVGKPESQIIFLTVEEVFEEE